MGKNISVAEAKANFSKCIRQVEAGSSVMITRHGKLVAALVRPDEVKRLERLRKAEPESGLAGIAGGWKDSGELADILEKSSRWGRRDVPDIEN